MAVLAFFSFLPSNSGNAGVPEPPDAFEDDDTSATASYIGVNGFDQTHTTHDDGDVDWVFFSVEADSVLEIETRNLGTQADTEITLFDAELNEIETDDDQSTNCPRCDIITRIGESSLPTGLYFVRVRTSPSAIVTGFGPDTEYDLRVWKPEAPCAQGCTTTLSGKVTDPITQDIVDANVEIIRDLGLIDSYSIRDDLITDSMGVYVICDVDANEAEAGPATPYLVTIAAPGFPIHIGAVSIFKCQDTVLDLTLNKDNLAVAEVDFSRSEFEVQDGSAAAPYQTLRQGVLGALPEGIINLQPGSTSETFTGGGEITKAVQLVNANPGSGLVIIGAASARRAGRVRAEVEAGFVSRP